MNPSSSSPGARRRAGGHAFGAAARRLLLALLVGMPVAAQARVPIQDRLDEIESASSQVSRSTTGLEEQIGSGRGAITPAQAVQRYQDHVYLHMIGEYEQAAEGFFTLVTTLALNDAGLHRDAEWYLAESLYQMGNLATAEARYQVIADDMQHPFRDDAVRRLLELYADSGQSEAFHAYYEQEILKGRVRPSDLITYSVGKAFHAQGESGRAKASFLEIGPESPFYHKAQYHYGAILVLEGALDQAEEVFRTLADASLDTYEDRLVHDLALLALGRLNYEQGDFAEAAEFYGRIGGDSEYLPDMLYEIAWTFIKQEQYDQALEGVDFFLLAYPEHEYAAQLRVLQGHLHMKRDAHDAALSSYEQVIEDYTPIRERFASLASSDDEPAQYFEQILEIDDTGSGDLPAYAVNMMMADAELSRALTIYRELERQRSNIEVSEGIISELETVLGASFGIGGFEQLRYDAVLQQSLATELQLSLLEAEELWLRENLSDASALSRLETLSEQRRALRERSRAEADSRETERAALQDRLVELDEQATALTGEIGALRTEARTTRDAIARAALEPEAEAEAERRLAEVEGELASSEQRLGTLREEQRAVAEQAASVSDVEGMLRDDIAALRSEFVSLRRTVASAGQDRLIARVDGLHTAVEHDQSRLSRILAKVESAESSELGRVRARFNREVKNVEGQRADLERTLHEAQDVSVGLTRAGFGRLEDFFAESVLKADMGIVDVYWAEKMDVADQKSRIQEERSVLLSDLERRFQLIRQKLNQ